MSQDNKKLNANSVEDAFNKAYNDVAVNAGSMNLGQGNLQYPEQDDMQKQALASEQRITVDTTPPITRTPDGRGIIIPGKPDLTIGITGQKYREELSRNYITYKERSKNPAIPVDAFEPLPNSNFPSDFAPVRVPIAMSKVESVRMHQEFNINQFRMNGLYLHVYFKDCTPVPDSSGIKWYFPGVSDVDSDGKTHNGYAIIQDHFLFITRKDILNDLRQKAIDRFNQKGQTIKQESEQAVQDSVMGVRNEIFDAYFEVPEVTVEEFIATGDPLSRAEREYYSNKKG